MLSFLDATVILVSLFTVVAAVLRAVRRKGSGTDYFLAGRDLTWPFVGMSLFASNISAEHVIGMAGDGYRIGLVAGGYEWTGAWDLIILATLFARSTCAAESLRFRSSWKGGSAGACERCLPRISC